jgi:sorting and assembly machinery component 37
VNLEIQKGTDELRPSSVDLRLYAHLALLLAPLPNSLLGDLLRSTYPALVQHHDRISALLPTPTRIAAVESTKSWRDLLPAWSSGSTSKPKATKPKTSKEKSFERARWAWFATAGVGMITYLFASGILAIELGGSEEEEGSEWKDASELDLEEEEEVIVVEEDEE